ncbi:MAG: ABC-F family ATP-binding cassette domain-containing protein [Elusimicrobia bacterium]|nr:ABC-F family ATP-binding cassette domain-containing protein [Elusimicrobiota bacterium]
MITLRNVAKSFGQQLLFQDAALQINEGDRYVLVGPNGSGKSTLFKILLGIEEADSGQFTTKRGAKVGYLPQENAPVTQDTVLDTALEHHEDPDGRLTAKAKAILMGLGFRVADFDKRLDTLSGGWAMRAAMARLLMQEPDLILLDEPTNHLDIDALFWLQSYLQSYPGAVFLISHDRAFINAVCRGIVSLQDHTLRVYHGDYEFYLREREAEKERLLSAWTRQQEEIADMEDFIARNRVRFSTASRVQSMIKRLEKLERIELPPDAKTVKIRFPQPSRTGVHVLTLRDVRKSYGETKVYDGLDFELERGWKVAFVGHNGAGKSTLLKMLAGAIPFDSGEMSSADGVRVGYFSQHREGQFGAGRTVLQEAQASSSRMNSDLFVRTVLGTFLFPGDTVYKPVEVLSGGEKSRLALVKLLLDPPNVLLLDEPTTHLDMASVDALVEALRDFEGTICAISHDLYFLNAIADHVVHIDQGRIIWYPGNYEYFKHRQSQWHEENPQAVAVPKLEKPKPGAQSRAVIKDEKARAKRKTQLENQVLKLHEELESLAAKLSDPALYSDFAQVKTIGDRMEQVQADLQAKEAELDSL